MWCFCAVGSDWEIGSDITEGSLMLNDEFDVGIGELSEVSDVWDLELLGGPENENRNTVAPMETGSLPALPPSEREFEKKNYILTKFL